MDQYDSVLDAYVQSSLGKRRWFLHDRGGATIATSQQEMSFLQQRFLILAQNEYGMDESDLPPEARRHV